MFKSNYLISNRILNNISKIEAAEETISHAPLLPLWEKEFKDDAVVRSVYHGTHIEGNKLDKSEAKDVLLGLDVVGRPRDIQEIINYRKVIELIDDEAKRNIDKITEPLIKKLHRITTDKILPPEQIGEYRIKQVVVRNSATGEITFNPPPPIQIPFMIREFIYWINRENKDEIHPILKAGIAHHQLVYIHPFIDGNGRVARALATLILFIEGYDIRRFFSLEEYYDKDAKTYYEHLQKASAGNMTSWLEYFTYGAAREFDRVREKVLKLSRDVKLKERFGGKQIFLTDRQVKIIEYMQEVGYLQNKNFAFLFREISEDTVLRDLHDLSEMGIVKKVGSTKAARYILI
ncbi:MAG: Fic family protein [bacterium]